MENYSITWILIISSYIIYYHFVQKNWHNNLTMFLAHFYTGRNPQTLTCVLSCLLVACFHHCGPDQHVIFLLALQIFPLSKMQHWQDFEVRELLVILLLSLTLVVLLQRFCWASYEITSSMKSNTTDPALLPVGDCYNLLQYKHYIFLVSDIGQDFSLEIMYLLS